MKVDKVEKMIKNHELAWEALDYLGAIADDNDESVFKAVNEVQSVIHYLENEVLTLEREFEQMER